MYSKSFTFFIKNQIGVACTDGGRKTTFFSRLNGQCFKRTETLTALTDDKIKEICYTIFKTI